MKKIIISLNELRGEDSGAALTDTLLEHGEIVQAKFDAKNRQLNIKFDDAHISADEIKALIETAGGKVGEITDFTASNREKSSADHQQRNIIISLLFTLLSLYLELTVRFSLPFIFAYDEYPLLYVGLQLLFVIPVLFTGFKTIKGGIVSALNKNPNEDTVTALALSACLVYALVNTLSGVVFGGAVLSPSFWAAGAVIISFSLSVKYVENRTERKLSQYPYKPEYGNSRSANTAESSKNISVYCAMVLALVCAVLWLIFGAGIYASVTVFISICAAACPAAFRLSSCLASQKTIGTQAENEIYFADADCLEKSSMINYMVFDKSGILTQSIFSVSDIMPEEGLSQDEFIQIAASAENGIVHPLAKAITAEAEKRGRKLFAATRSENIPGFGVKSLIMNKTVKIGTADFADTNGSKGVFFEVEGKTVVHMSVNGRYAGFVALVDDIREEAPEAIRELKKIHIGTAMITADNDVTANAVAEKIGIENVYANVQKEKKAEYIGEVKTDKRTIAMVGDGNQDAGALSAADIGIYVGADNKDKAGAFSIISLGNDLNKVTEAIKASRHTAKTIKRNFMWAVCLNILAAAVAAGVPHIFGLPFIDPAVCACFLALAELPVIRSSVK